MKNNKDKSQSVSAIAWQRLKKNKLSMFGLVLISCFILIAVLGFLITPDSSPDANNQKLELSKKPPGFKVQMLMVRKNEETHHVSFITKMLFGEISDYNSIPISEYRFEGSNIIIKEFSNKIKNLQLKRK